MNLGGAGTADGVAAVLGDNDDDDAVDPHLTRIRNQAADESDEEASTLCLTELLHILMIMCLIIETFNL